mmetsp:Transcript_18847/g.56021  ORF Transcript_18847/g.56021 Transcript_18847/m.56021 type:complete len:504 (+) Transcript_18847:249-1760(+)
MNGAPPPRPEDERLDTTEPRMSFFTEFTVYFAYALLIVVGHVRDFWGRLTGRTRFRTLLPARAGGAGARLAPLLKSWENFYTRRLYDRLLDVFNRPICSSPGAWITLESRAPDAASDLAKTGATQRCLNLGSYNYLGFADDWLRTCGPPVLGAAGAWPVSTGSSRSALGTTALHRRLEARVARFVGKEDAVVFNMGYGTNSTTVPALVGRGDLIVSDELNHASIVNGCRASGAMIRSFAHNDAAALEAVLREAVAYGAPRTRRPWRKILVMVEGIYSMEGEICDLKAIAAVAKKYRAYLYLDEAHSIGALGNTGRGACEHCGVDPADVTVLMGTFTKSFGGMGGYVAGDKALVDHLRVACPGILTHDAMSPVMCAQVTRALELIMGDAGDGLGRRKIDALKANSNFMRTELLRAGLHVYGDYDSPIIPVLLYNPTKIGAFSRECLKRGLAVVVVGFPATTLVKSRARFCVSAGHSRADLEDALLKIKEVAALIKIRYAVSPFG